MFIGCTEANWWVLYFCTFIPNNSRFLEKLRNEESDDANDDVLDDEANKDKDNGAVDGPTVLAHVELARMVRKYIASTLRL
jgi:hypothetical protein